MLERFRVDGFVAILCCLTLAGCGGVTRAGVGAGYTPAVESLPPNGAARSGMATSTLPILTDTSSSTSGVFFGIACGAHAAVACPNFASTFRAGIAFGTTYASWDNDLAQFITAYGINTWPSQGIVPEITWQPTQSGGTVTFTGINNGLYDGYLKKSADELRAFGSPVFLRPFHEFNGKWYPWGLANQVASMSTDAAFVQAWRRIRTIFSQEGASNVKFIWCFSRTSIQSNTVGAWDYPPNSYPGDQYVDWIGFDSYNHATGTSGTWQTFDQTVAKSYALAVSISGKKPVMWAEGATNEYGDGGAMKAGWVNAMFSELSSGSNPYPNLRAITWFETDTSTYAYDSMSTSPVYNAFVNDLRATASNGVLYFRSNGSAFAGLTAP